MKLVIAEKPSVGRAIAEAVGARARKDGYMEGSGYIVSWCRGHVVDLAKPDAYDGWGGRWTLETLPMIPEAWTWKVTEAEQFKVVSTLLARDDVDVVYNACDADREGEGIFRRVARMVGLDKPVLRFWSTSLVPEQILSDLASAKDSSEFDGLGAASEGRAKADWLVGMNASRAYSVLYSTRFSAGRVQTPTLSLVVDRTRAVRAFKPTPFYQVELDLGGFKVFGERLGSEAEARDLAARCAGKSAAIISVERAAEKNRAPRLYDLTGLQRDASTRAGLSAERTLAAAQSLYEKKLSTYPRTDSKFIGSSDAEAALRALDLVCDERIVGPAAEAFDRARSDVSRLVDDSKVHGHGALLPTELCTADAVMALSGDELAVMRLICGRLLAATMDAATRVRTRLAAACEGSEFRAGGSAVTDASWMAVDDAVRALVGGKGDETADDKDPEQAVPESIAQGDRLDVVSTGVRQGKTSAPKLYTDATLLSAMENAGRTIEDKGLRAAIEDDSTHSGGLGTPATRAATIELLIADGYVRRKGKSLEATERGCAVVDAVSPSLKTPELTAQWEAELSRVEAGELGLDEFLDGISGYTRLVVDEAKSSFDPARVVDLVDGKALGSCPECGKPVVRRGGLITCTSNRFSGASDGYRLLEGCGFKLYSKQCRRELKDAEVSALLEKGRVHLDGLLKKDGSTFGADVEVAKPYEGWVRFCKGPAGGSGGRKGRSSPPKRARGRGRK